ncbi:MULTISPECIES: lactonase family protein [unclassified Streptomyces]|uniref:lactonase family protein n=1 Tax=unclassified Streptomyces TaxID=2593676 RepID=UPI001BE60A41|nr:MULTISPECIES: lactonase family protein [unclassified Streptomyces]MBT2407794.1 lactonase family protein [Streptomyces sp. ISL-21]MBT2608516.1 lactonase family protein [Streptomyces sp. ISL-87]
MGGADSTDQGGGHRAYIGSFTSGGGRGITTAAADPLTGALTPLAATDAVRDPSYLAHDRRTGVLYAVSETGQGAVGVFRTAGEGLVPLGTAVHVGGAGPTHLSVAGRRLITANYTSGSVSVLPLAADGSIEGPASVLAHRGSGPDADRQEGPHAHQALPDPTGRWVLSVDLGTDSVRVCAPDPATAALRVHSETALRAGTGPRHLAFHPEGRVAYVLHELEPQLTVCRWNPGSGHLEILGEVPVASGGHPGAARAYPSAIVASRDGRFVWVAIRGADTIATLSLAGGAEKPELTGTVGCGGSWPRDLAADPSGRRLYAANERSGDVTWFDVDPLTGQPRRAGSVAVPAATCVVFG